MSLGSTQPLNTSGVFPGGKGNRCVRLTTLPQFCAVVMKSGNLNFLEPSGPLQACNGTAIPLPFYTVHTLCVPTVRPPAFENSLPPLSSYRVQEELHLVFTFPFVTVRLCWKKLTNTFNLNENCRFLGCDSAWFDR
jgi:hypothetical protein